MEAFLSGYSLGTEVFRSRSEAIQSVTDNVTVEVNIFAESKKNVPKGMPTSNDSTLGRIDTEILSGLKKSLILLGRIVNNDDTTLDIPSADLSTELFKKSGHTPVLLLDQLVDNAVQKAYTLLVTAQSLRELKGIFKEFTPLRTVDTKLAASLLRDPDKSSSGYLIQKLLSLYKKAEQIPGYKEWREKNNRHDNSAELKKLEALGKHQITVTYKARDDDLYSGFSFALDDLALEIIDYSKSLVKDSINEGP